MSAPTSTPDQARPEPETFGPWGWTYDGSSGYSIGDADDPQAKPVAHVHSRDPRRGEALCHLLTSAPDLLSALKYLVELGGDDDRRIAAEAAIAKAEGRPYP